MSQNKKNSPDRYRKLSDIQYWDLETDVAIVGYGGAGACAAIEACDAGAEVIIFEAFSSEGGSTILSSADVYMGGSGGTRVQQACGFTDRTEDMFNYLMASAGSLADENKIRAYCEGSKDHFEWLVNKGVVYKDSFHEERTMVPLTDDCLLATGSEYAWPFSQQAQPSPRGHNPQAEGDSGGPAFFKALSDSIESRAIEVKYESRVLCLIADDDRQVHGLVVRINQQQLCVKARRGVILCAGGFAMNETMLRQYAPGLLKCNMPIGNPGDTGSGIKMGISVGAAAIHMSEGFVSLPYYPPASLTYSILVNDQGQRFINEDCYHGRVGAAILQQNSNRIYMICGVEEYGSYEQFSYLGAEIAGTGETPEELEQELKLAPGSLQHTLSFYNQHAADGEDPLFHKTSKWLKALTPPLVALDCTPGRGAFFPFFTLGGLDTKVTGEVLTPSGEPIPGLFAAGRTACGVPRCAEGYASGLSVGDATFSGRMAGLAAASRKKNGSM